MFSSEVLFSYIKGDAVKTTRYLILQFKGEVKDDVNLGPSAYK